VSYSDITSEAVCFAVIFALLGGEGGDENVCGNVKVILRPTVSRSVCPFVVAITKSKSINHRVLIEFRQAWFKQVVKC
jgi:hypothetical protein